METRKRGKKSVAVVLTVILIAVLAAFALAGCQGSTGEPGESKALSVKTLPTKTEYYVGDTVDLTGGVLLYGEAEVSMTADGVSAAYSTETAAEAAKVTLTYEDKTAAFNIKIVGISSVSVVMTPEMPAVELGGQPDFTGGTLAVVYEDGFTREVPMTATGVTSPGFSSAAASDGMRVTLSYYGAETYCYLGVVVPIGADESSRLHFFAEAYSFITDFYNYPDSVDIDKIMYFYYSYLSIKDSFIETENEKILIDQFFEFVLEYWVNAGFESVYEYSPEVSLESIERASYMYREMYCRTVPREIFAESDDFLFMAALLDNAAHNFEFQAELAAYTKTAAPPAAEFAQRALEGIVNGDKIGFYDLMAYYYDFEVIAKLADVLHPGWGEKIEDYYNVHFGMDIDLNEEKVEAYEELCVDLKDAPQIIIDCLFLNINIEIDITYMDYLIANGADVLEDVWAALLKVEDYFKAMNAEDFEAALEDVAALKQAYDALPDDYKRNLLVIEKYVFVAEFTFQSPGLFSNETDFSGISFDEVISVARMLLSMNA